MARDYKHAKRSTGKKSGAPNFFIGLALGLAVAGGVHWYHLQASGQQRLAQADPAPDKNQTPAPASQGAEPQEQLDFYESLPKFEVVVPDKPAGGAAAAIEKPGAYVLQAGSYRTHGEADRVKALLALQGVQSRIERAPLENETWHRVRIGPIRNLPQLEDTRRKIREAQIDALVIRVPD
jgi:cell division protein FtsN